MQTINKKKSPPARFFFAFLGAILFFYHASYAFTVNCVRTGYTFPLLETQKKYGLTDAQKRHLKLLSDDVSSKLHNTKRLFVFSLFKYMNNFSILGDADCSSHCMGSLYFKTEKGSEELHDIIFDEDGRIILQQAPVGAKAAIFRPEAENKERVEITIAAKSYPSDKIYYFTQKIDRPDFTGLNSADPSRDGSGPYLSASDQLKLFNRAESSLHQVDIRELEQLLLEDFSSPALPCGQIR